jgi:hypothetical protein
MNEEMQMLIHEVREHPAASFYRDAWGRAQAFDTLPLISRADFIAAPLSRRRYRDSGGFLKIVRGTEGDFLTEWDFDDLTEERFAELTERPMVHLSDSHEAVEKGLWYKLKGTLAFIGERNLALTEYAARTYDIDSLLADGPSLQLLQPYLASRSVPLEHLSITGSAFSAGALTPFFSFAKKTRLVLALPETGVIATADPATGPHFVPEQNCLVEIREGRLVVTKKKMLATPIIRYDTSLVAERFGNFFRLV